MRTTTTLILTAFLAGCSSGSASQQTATGGSQRGLPPIAGTEVDQPSTGGATGQTVDASPVAQPDATPAPGLDTAVAPDLVAVVPLDGPAATPDASPTIPDVSRPDTRAIMGPEAGPDVLRPLPYGTGTNTTTASSTATQTYPATATTITTATGTIVSSGTLPKTSYYTYTATATSTYTGTTTATNGCTDIQPPPQSDGPITCAHEAAVSGCQRMTTPQPFCNATCLFCNGGCADVLPAAVDYQQEQTGAPFTSCAEWVQQGRCANWLAERDSVGTARFFCRRSCALCVPETP